VLSRAFGKELVGLGQQGVAADKTVGGGGQLMRRGFTGTGEMF